MYVYSSHYPLPTFDFFLTGKNLEGRIGKKEKEEKREEKRGIVVKKKILLLILFPCLIYNKGPYDRKKQRRLPFSVYL